MRETLVKQHPRESFLLANKLPTFAISAKEQIRLLADFMASNRFSFI